jgi:hypothetical protein
LRRRRQIPSFGNRPDHVDHGIAGQYDAFSGYSFAKQVSARSHGRREVESGDLSGQSAVRFLRERIGHVEAAQAGLDVTNRNTLIERRESRGEHSCGISLDKNHVRPLLREQPVDTFQYASRQRGELLARPHEVQVDIWTNIQGC